MAWPTNKPNSNQFDSDSDSIKQSRPELKTMSDAVNDIVDYIDTTAEANGYILQFNSTSGKLEYVVNSGGGGLQNPLNEDIDLNGQRFENSSTAANDSFGAEGLVLGSSIDTIQFINTGTNQIYAPQTLDIYSASSAVRINTQSVGGTVTLGNQGATQINGDLILAADGSPPLAIEAQGSGSSNADFTIGNQDKRASITIENIRNPSAASRTVSGSSEPSFEAITIKPWAADTGTFRYANYLNLHASNIRLGDPAFYTTDSAGRKYVIVETSDDQIQMRLGSQNGGRIFLDPSDSAGGGDISFYPGTSNIIRLNYTNWPTTDGSSGQVLQTNGSGQLSWATVSGGGGGGTVDINAGTGISVTSPDSADGYVISNTGMINLSDDSSPEMGGDLNTANFDIISNSGVDIDIAPNNANLNLKTSNTFLGTGTAQANLTTNGAQNIEITTNNNTNSGTIKINQGASGNIEIQPDGGGRIRLHNAYNMPSVDGTNGQVMTTDGAGNISFTTVSGGGGDGVRDINAGTGISIQQDDSAGGYTISSTVTGGDTVSAGDNIEITAPDSTGAKGINLKNPFDTQVDFGDQILKRPVLEDYAETQYPISTGGSPAPTTVTPDLSQGNVQTVELNTAHTFNTPSNMSTGGSMTLIIRQPTAGSKTITWAAGYKFAGGSKTISSAGNAIDIVTIYYDGTDYLASLSTNFS